ncbi:depupylase/deamidase Dop [Arthrobacter gengyunqii]|uniref:Proteasome accessory factor PafA2 n=1 Tax=Arthrobacter gengyunqii TaxID=2886940 RepID=A0ABS8GE81_9MICC|nr:depupylase/deamidase Dop [Arthrobacter gengyunqii]MCC3264939.1 proteasome accessory factor PafA2 [Arthrobacter gengyunqii]
MSVRRVMGTETEYGVLAPGLPAANATVLSSQIVNAYAASRRSGMGNFGGTRWDYTDEAPLNDARGYTVPRTAADPTQLTDVPPVLDAEQIAMEGGGPAALYGEQTTDNPVLMNMVLNNGARLYVDHAHPEYSSPEVTTPRDAVLWDKAGDAVVLAAVRYIAAAPGFSPVNLYKNNTDSKGASYGSHENYLVPRSVPFTDLVRGLVPFFASRQVIVGSGRVGIGTNNQRQGYQLSQRADFFEAEVGLETTIRRPIVNTRDEPHAVAEKYRRLHVIIGDANLSEVSMLLKVGTTSIVLSMIEEGTAPEVELRDPVGALQAISHDPALQQLVELKDGRRVTGLDLQEIYLEAAARHCRSRGADADTEDILGRWTALVGTLKRDPMEAAASVDWVAKLKLLQAYRNRDSLAWSDARLHLVDLQYSDMRPEKGLYYRLAARGQMERLLGDEEIARAVNEPPDDTRAYFRGKCVSRFPRQVVGASWDSIIFELPSHRRLQRIPTREPLKGTRALTEELFEASADAEDFVTRLLSGPEHSVAP